MKTIVLLSCVSKKCDFRCEAKNMYKSPLFIKSYNYAKSLKVDDIYIYIYYRLNMVYWNVLI